MKTRPRFNGRRPSFIIRELESDAEAEEFERIIQGQRLELNVSGTDMELVRSRQGGRLLGAFFEGQLVGGCYIYYSSEGYFRECENYEFNRLEQIYPGRVAFILDLAFAPEFRRRYLLIKFFQEALKLSRNKGVEICVIDTLHHPVRIMLRMGFRPFKIRSLDFGNPFPVMILFYRDIDHLQIVRSPLLPVLNS